ncbi:hypothetical protein FHG87_023506 [Trinorchestia longiramus]|nr:hypothetical protein FHG87_023506 [Trinorchestia longiramus]
MTLEVFLNVVRTAPQMAFTKCKGVVEGYALNGGLITSLVDYHQLGRLVSESACERKDPGSNPAADMVDAARNTAWDLGKQPNNYRSNYPTQEWARSGRSNLDEVVMKHPWSSEGSVLCSATRRAK